METKKTKTPMQVSKKMVLLDYTIGVIMFIFFIVCEYINYLSYKQFLTVSPDNISSYVAPIDISTIGVVLTAWIAQLGISSAAYYFMCKSDHAIELPAKMIKELPKEMRDNVDATQVMVAAITTKN